MKEYTLSEIATIKSGKRLPKGHELSNTPSPYPYIKAKDIKKGKVNSIGLEFVDESTRKKIAKYIVSENDVLITIVANIGDVGIVPKKLNHANLTENAVRLTNLKLFVDAQYLTYILSQKDYKEYMESLAAGAAQAKLGIYKIEKIKINLPELSIQKHIASILSAYDNLIEVNNQRIELLEQSARELYKEWFVRMRFPNYQNTKFNKGIPEGWKINKINENISFQIGGGWGEDKKNITYTIPAYIIRGTDIPKIKLGIPNKDIYRFHKPGNIKSRELIEGDIIFEAAGGSEGQLLGRTCYITNELLETYGDKVIPASFCKLIRAEKKISLYLYYFLNYLYNTGLIETFQLQSTGISNYQFEPFLKFQEMIIPPDNLLINFHERTLLIQKQIALIGKQNQELTAIRDRLLPRLISGKLEVKA